MIMRGIDEAWAKLDPALAASQGFGFIVGYVSQDESKNLTTSDIQRIHAAGLAVAFVMEYNASAALGGRPAGIDDGNVALQHFATLGVPSHVACYSAGTDFNVLPGEMSTCWAFEQGFASTMDNGGYRYGAYTGYPFGLYMTQRNYVGFIWQTYAWSNGAWLANAALRQTSNGVHIAGIDLDIDESEVVDFGQWNPGSDPLVNKEIPVVFKFVVPDGPVAGGIYYGLIGGGFWWMPDGATQAVFESSAHDNQVTISDSGSFSMVDATARFGPYIPRYAPDAGTPFELPAGTKLVVQ